MTDGYCEGCGYHPESCVCRSGSRCLHAGPTCLLATMEAERDVLRAEVEKLQQERYEASLRWEQASADTERRHLEVEDKLRAEVERLKKREDQLADTLYARDFWWEMSLMVQLLTDCEFGGVSTGLANRIEAARNRGGWRAVQCEAKALLERAEAAEARVRELEQKIDDMESEAWANMSM